MKKISIITLLVFSLSQVLEARSGYYDERGFKVYLQKCKQCHGNPYKGAAMRKSKQWSKLFKNDAKKLIKLHSKIPEAKKIEAFTKRKSKMKHLRKFLMQSASDSGVVTGCDGNFCG